MKKLVSLVMAVLLCLTGITAMAAQDATVTMRGASVSEGAKDWKVSCSIAGSGKITNGKVRITYDPQQLELQSDEIGAALSGATADINDSLEGGNKEPGEALLVFASASELDANGSLMDMVFALKDGVKNGDTIEIQVKVEELACNEEDINFTEEALSLEVGDENGGNLLESGDEPESKKEPDSESQSDSDTENKNQDDSEKQSNGSSSGGGTDSTGQSGSGNQSDGGSQSTQSNQTGSSSKTTSQVKTGDETNILLPVGMAAAAVVVLAAAGIGIAKKKKKEQN